jgi:HEAT repeat protein
MRLVFIAILAVGIFGCGKPKTMLAGGKPVSYWVQAVCDPDPRLRKQAVFKLGNVGPTQAEALPAVTKALKDQDAAVRREAILALLKFGADAKAAAPILAELRNNDRDAQVRKYAALALDKLRG